MDLHEISLKSRFFLSRSGEFLLESGFLSDNLGFSGFGGREPETNPPESDSSGEDLPPTAGVVGSVDVGFDPVGFFGWVGSSNGFG